MHRIAVFIFFTVFPALALPCRVDLPWSFHKSVSEATQLYIFRLESLAQVKDTVFPMHKGPDGTYLPAKAEDIYTGRVAGRITVMRVLRGRPTAKYIEFSTSECAGLRLDVGHYFFVATSEVGPLLRLGAGDRSVIDLRSEYHEANPREYNDRQPFLSTILQFLHGKPLPKKFPSIEMIQYTQSGAMPPLLPDEER